MSESHSARIDAYLAGPGLLRRVVSEMTLEQLQARPVPGRWSTLEVVCHLGDSEQAWCHRFKRVIAEDKPLLIGYDETKFTATLPYQSADLAEELDLFERQRRQMARALRLLPDSAWERQGVHTQLGLVRLDTMLQIETDHVTDHVRHILEKRRALGLAST